MGLALAVYARIYVDDHMAISAWVCTSYVAAD